MADTLKTKRFFRDYVAGIASPWFVSINRSINAATGIMGAILQQCKDNLSQTQIAVTNASMEAQSAGQSAQAASNSATQSQQSASNAQDFANQVKSLASSYSKMWLGDLTADPTTDNQGSPLVDGARYYNTASKHTRIYQNGSWSDIDASTEAAQQDALVSASQAAQSAATVSGLYAQVSQAASQTQNILSQAQSILYWQNTYWLGSNSSDPTTDRNGNPVSNGATYYNSQSNVTKTYQNGIWKIEATTDITDDIKNRYVDGTWSIGDNLHQVKGVTWSLGDVSPLVTYLNESGTLNSALLATKDQLSDNVSTLTQGINNSLSGITGLHTESGDQRGVSLYYKGSGVNLPYFTYGDTNNPTGVTLASQSYVDGINDKLLAITNSISGNYVKIDGSIPMTGRLDINMGNRFDLFNGSEQSIHATGCAHFNSWFASPSFLTGMTQNQDGAPVSVSTGIRSSYDQSKDMSYADIYHTFFGKTSISLEMWSDGHTVTPGDVWAGGDKNSSFYGKSLYVPTADVAELYQSDRLLIAGQVVKISTRDQSELDLAGKGDRVFGIVSTDPGLILNNQDKASDYYPIALAGRVPVYVSGTVNKGDLLVVSDYTGRLKSRPNYSLYDKILNWIHGYEDVIVATALESNNEGKNSKIEVVLTR